MCEGINCPIKLTCYRHTANKNEYRQSYFCEIPYDYSNNSCEYYSENKLIEGRK